jgi:MYXO-CTERM domain-containing protein
VACDNNLYSAAAYCDGIGSCDAPKTSDCGAYSCGPGGCKVQCLTSDDCAEGFACNSDNTCKPIPGAGGAGGEGGAAGQGGDGGAAGAGKAGDGGTGVVAGTGGVGGQGGAGKGGTGGTGGTGGAAGEAGKGGQAAPPNTDFDPGSEGGCGCRTTGSSAPSSSPLALGALVLAAALLRRRRRAALRVAPLRQPRVAPLRRPRADRPWPRGRSRRGVRVSTGSPGYRA